MSLLLAGGTVVTALDPVSVVEADVLVEEGRVTRVGGEAGLGPDAPVNHAAAPYERIDCRGTLVIPGNVCAHTHAYSALARGMPYRLEPPSTFLEVLRRVWWRLDRALDERSIESSALVVASSFFFLAVKPLRAGTTTLIDHHASPNAIDGSLDVVAEAFAAVGIRAVCCYEVTDRDGPERARAGIEENRRFLARVARGRLPLARAMVGAHASFTLSDGTLAACVDLARGSSSGLHIHVAEDAADEQDAERRLGVRVVERLAANGALGPAALLAHGVHLDEAEAALVRESGTTLAHNARSNMNNRVGRARLHLLGERVALGTDGIGADMFAESQAAWLRLRDDGAAPDASWPLARLARGAAFAGSAFGEPGLGTIAPGAPADLVVLDRAAPTPLESSTLPGHWLFGLGAQDVRDVVVAGRVVLRGRVPTQVDRAAVAGQAREEALRLWSRLEDIPVHPFDPREVPH
jgi:putative selenium metabolism protein SsnA